MQEDCILCNQSFSFETVLSTTRNIELLKKAKDKGYFIRCIYVLTADPQINVLRVKTRFAKGGHDVPADKVISRYKKALELVPTLLQFCDICHIYDNSLEKAFRIFKKRKAEYFYWENDLWNLEKIKKLVGAQ